MTAINKHTGPGNLQVTCEFGNRVIVSDPCYQEWQNETIIPVVAGEWQVKVCGEWKGNDGRDSTYRYFHTQTLIAWHSGKENLDTPERIFAMGRVVGNAGVDAGCLGLYDCNKYAAECETQERHDAFFQPMMDACENDNQPVENGYKPFCDWHDYGYGLATRTSYGDGCYTVVAVKNNDGDAVAIMVDLGDTYCVNSESGDDEYGEDND